MMNTRPPKKKKGKVAASYQSFRMLVGFIRCEYSVVSMGLEVRRTKVYGPDASTRSKIQTVMNLLYRREIQLSTKTKAEEMML
jgi:hypothetical protein